MRVVFLGDSLTAGRPGVSYFRLLQQANTNRTLVNLGRGGDSVISLYRRLSRMPHACEADIAFVWIGLNDVFPRVSWTFPWVRRLLRHPWSRDRQTFESYYRRLLDLVSPKAHRVVAVAPLMLGERPENEWNRQLAALSESVCSIASEYANVEYLDLRLYMPPHDSPPSGYVASRAICVLRDALLLKTPQRVDRVAARRGLSLTLDGAHLNSAGAAAVAAAFHRAMDATPADR
ncbi:MAG: SGNH/GDSL hydrolase family protein [Coriobacteriia bacterium]|nr:SGNH/GDSL hydrolase family protein [Coriobacteriia bacterium]